MGLRDMVRERNGRGYWWHGRQGTENQRDISEVTVEMGGKWYQTEIVLERKGSGHWRERE